MNIEIKKENLILDMYGFSGEVPNHNYGEVGVGLMDKMWHIIKANNISNKGINIWVYNTDRSMMAGVELLKPPPSEFGLEHQLIHIIEYAYYKHIGPYTELFQVNATMRKELSKKGILFTHPCIEIYGHSPVDMNKAETEIIWAIQTK